MFLFCYTLFPHIKSKNASEERRWDFFSFYPIIMNDMACHCAENGGSFDTILKRGWDKKDFFSWPSCFFFVFFFGKSCLSDYRHTLLTLCTRLGTVKCYDSYVYFYFQTTWGSHKVKKIFLHYYYQENPCTESYWCLCLLFQHGAAGATYFPSSSSSSSSCPLYLENITVMAL